MENESLVSKMKTYTTKKFSELPDSDSQRSNGPAADALILFNESETIELEATLDEIEGFQSDHGVEINADVIDDQLMADLIEFLNTNRLLDIPV